jgi:amino acid transporter
LHASESAFDATPVASGCHRQHAGPEIGAFRSAMVLFCAAAAQGAGYTDAGTGAGVQPCASLQARPERRGIPLKEQSEAGSASSTGDPNAGPSRGPQQGPSQGQAMTLRRSLSLWHALLYGLGVTIGAGIYVLIGPAAGKAGMAAPAAFVTAAILMAFSAASFAELATRMPVAAGEAAYVAEGFRSRWFGVAVGLVVIAIAITTSATIAVGSADYIRVFVDAPAWLVIAAVCVAMGAIAAWGIVESVTFAGVMTLIETGGLVLVAVLGFALEPGAITRLPEAIPDLATTAHLQGLLGAGIIAVFAFIGFESIVNVAEEMRQPSRDLPRAILLTLAISTALYVAVMWIALVAIGPATLAATKAPLAAVFQHLTGWPPKVMAAIAIVATLNGIIVSIILAARVAYGLAVRSELPAVFARLEPRTRTPVAGTAIITAVVLVLALAVPLEGLAELSSHLTLAMFAAVNLALVLIKAREPAPPPGVFVAPRFVPLVGFLATIAFAVAALMV